MKSFIILILYTLSFIARASNDEAQLERLQLGTFQSRALFGKALDSSKKLTKPLVILIPGSGPNGPESIMPPQLTLDNQYHALLTEFSTPLRKAGFHTLQLGKPGVEFFNPKNPQTQFYDINLLKNLKWQGYLDNIKSAVEYAKTRNDVDSDHIVLLGHSQGTQLAVDFAKNNYNISALILLGYSGEDMKTTLQWQLYRREIDKLISPDVDSNHDGIITKEEADRWPTLSLGLGDSKKSITLNEIEILLRSDKNRQAIFDSAKNSPSMEGVFDRGPIYQQTASLNIPVFIMTGSLDVQTLPEEALKLKDLSEKANRSNIYVSIIPGLGHGFSVPRPPRSHPLLDLTVGPVDTVFQQRLFEQAEVLIESFAKKQSIH